MKTIVLFRQVTLLLTGLFLCSCFPQAYSPSLDLAHDNLRRGQMRLGTGIELAPHAESGDDDEIGVLPVVQAKAAVGLSTNSELHLKISSNFTNGLGAVLSGNFRVAHGLSNDLLIMPRIGTSSIFGRGGYGGGAAAVWRRRPNAKVATWTGIGYYKGNYNGDVSSDQSGSEVGNFSGNALALYLGGSWKVSDATQINFELNPLLQKDTYFNRSVLVPSAKIGVSFALNERRYLKAERARKPERK